MTSPVIPSKRFTLWTRLYSRLLLEPDALREGGLVGVLPYVMVTLDGDALLRTPSAQNGGLDLRGASGNFVAAGTVPANERWTLGMSQRGGTSSNSNAAVSVGGVVLNRSLPATPTEMVDMTGTVLDPGDAVGMLSTGNAGDNGNNFQWYYQLELLDR